MVGVFRFVLGLLYVINYSICIGNYGNNILLLFCVNIVSEIYL